MQRLILTLCFMGTSQCMHIRQMVTSNIIKRWSALNCATKHLLPTASKDQKRRLIDMYSTLSHDASRCKLPDISEHCDKKIDEIGEEISDDEVSK